MNKIITIALTEYGNAIRSKAFIIGLLAMPLMMGLMIAVPQLTKDNLGFLTHHRRSRQSKRSPNLSQRSWKAHRLRGKNMFSNFPIGSDQKNCLLLF